MPEPGTLLLVGTGLVAAALVYRRWRRWSAPGVY
ncbi:MAG: PEP-CTERM sorting domain-containing protein [Planctomycetota bacterium]